MIIGGENLAGPLDSVELFNIQNGHSCNFGKIPVGTSAPVGGIFEGFPVYCGGTTQIHLGDNTSSAERSCYKYKKSWVPVSSQFNNFETF
jgi:hypothetical protein